MKTVTANKNEVIDILRHNRDEHRQIFEEPLQGWHDRVLKALDEAMRNARDNKLYEPRVSIPRPQDHTRDYDRVIRMLELHQDATIDLDEREVAQYVQDDWNWQQDFLRMSNAFSASSRGKFSEMYDV